MPSVTIWASNVVQSNNVTNPELACWAPDGQYASAWALPYYGTLQVLAIYGFGQRVQITRVVAEVYVYNNNLPGKAANVNVGLTGETSWSQQQYGELWPLFGSGYSGWVSAGEYYPYIYAQDLTCYLTLTTWDYRAPVDSIRWIVDYEIAPPPPPPETYWTASDGSGIGSAETLSVGVYPQSSDAAIVSSLEIINVEEAKPFADSTTVSSDETVDVLATYPVVDDATISAAEDVQAAQLSGTADDAPVVSADALVRTVRLGSQPRQLRAVVRDASGQLVARLGAILKAKYRLSLDRIGQFELEVPAPDVASAGVQPSHVVHIYREDEGRVFAGIIDSITNSIDESGAVVARVAGMSMARELAQPAIVSASWSGQPLASVAADIVQPYGWTVGAAPTDTISARIAGVSPWQALSQLAQRVRAKLREDPLRKVVEIIRDPDESPIMYSSMSPPPDDPLASALPVARAEVRIDGTSVVTRVVPLGEVEYGRRAKLELSTRTAPYAIQSGTAEDGSTYYYIQSPHASQYGIITQVQTWSGLAPADDTTAEAERAANDLYDAAASWLMDRERPIVRLSIEPWPAYHIDTGGQYRVLPGDYVRARVRAVSQTERESRTAIVNIASSFYVIAIEREFEDSGADTWRMELADAPVPEPDELDEVSMALLNTSRVRLGVTPNQSPPPRSLWDVIIEGVTGGQTGTPWW